MESVLAGRPISITALYCDFEGLQGKHQAYFGRLRHHHHGVWVTMALFKDYVCVCVEGGGGGGVGGSLVPRPWLLPSDLGTRLGGGGGGGGGVVSHSQTLNRKVRVWLRETRMGVVVLDETF